MLLRICGYGGIGRRVRLRGVWATIRVQVPVTAPNRRTSRLGSFFDLVRLPGLHRITASQSSAVHPVHARVPRHCRGAAYPNGARCKASPGDQLAKSGPSDGPLFRFGAVTGTAPDNVLSKFGRSSGARRCVPRSLCGAARLTSRAALLRPFAPHVARIPKR